MILTSPYKEGGFSLLEILIAITLLAFVTIGIISIQDSSIDSSRQISEENQSFLQVETAMERMDWDFSHIYSPLFFSHEMRFDQITDEFEKTYFEQIRIDLARNERFSLMSYDGLPIPAYQAPDKETLVIFTTSNRRKRKDEKVSHFAWVKYSLEENDDPEAEQGSQMLVRSFYAQNPFSPDGIDWKQIRKQVLLRNVTGLKFEFWGETQRKWFDNIRNVTQGENILKGIKVTLNWLNLDAFEETTVRVFTPLFPAFTPEDMYQFRRQNNNRGNTPLGNGSNPLNNNWINSLRNNNNGGSNDN